MNFEIHASEVRLHHFQVRQQKEGEEEVTAIDLRLQWDTGNEALAMFNPALRSFLYDKPPPAQAPVEGVEPAPTVQRFKELAPLGWGDSAEGRVVAFHHALGEGADIVIADARANSFSIAALEGGTIRVNFRVQAKCSDERAIGRLGVLVHRTLPVSIVRAKDKGASDAPAGAVGTTPELALAATEPGAAAA